MIAKALPVLSAGFKDSSFPAFLLFTLDKIPNVNPTILRIVWVKKNIKKLIKKKWLKRNANEISTIIRDAIPKPKHFF